MKRKCLFIIVCSTAMLLTSCFEKIDVYVKHSNEEYFDFNLNQEVSLTINYGFPNKDYVVLFDIYDQNPLTEDENGQTIKKDIAPIYRAATDGEGKFNGKIQLPAILSEMYLYSDYPGTLSPVKLKITENAVSFNQRDYINNINGTTQTRATTPNKFTYPDSWLTLGDWNLRGTPNYLMAERKMPPADILYNMKKIYIEAWGNDNKPLKERFPQFFAEGVSSEVTIEKKTKVYLIYINSSASWNNTVGYFTYPKGKKPNSPSEIKQVIAFPSVTTVTDTKGGLSGGDRVQLKYWDGIKFQDEFPAGVTIGWWLEGDMFRNGNIAQGKYSRYSLSNLNSDGVQRTVSLLDDKTKQIVAIGFEDNIDLKYNDATFYLEVEEQNAIDTDILPSIPDAANPPSNKENSVSYYGTLTFEDLWPSLGDYDMNDVMIDYNCKVYKQIIGNSVYKIVDEFTPRHNGGTLHSGFGYQLHNLRESDIYSITIEGEGQSQYMAGQKFEPGQSHPTILLFDDIAKVIGKKFTITIELNDISESLVKPPYNPFIFIESNKGRGREVHLVKYPPTDKVDISFFGTGSDGSRPEEGLYYVSSRFSWPFPFALNMTSVKDFPIPEEYQRIDDSYPEFTNWVKTNGASNKDWYKYPKK